MLSVCCSFVGSNNTNKLSPQEPTSDRISFNIGSNNTNKLSPQEHVSPLVFLGYGSNNTNKLSPQELSALL